MPLLRNPRHERFAQELAKGGTNEAAYVAAGYKPDRGSASRLLSNANVRQRLGELQAEMAAKTVEQASMTRASVLAELAKLAMASVDDIRASDKRNALLNIAQIEGWVVSKNEHTGPGGGPIRHDFSGLTDEQLTQLRSLVSSVTAPGGDRRGDPAETSET